MTKRHYDKYYKNKIESLKNADVVLLDNTLIWCKMSGVIFYISVVDLGES